MKVTVDSIFFAYSNAYDALKIKLNDPTSLIIHEIFPDEYNVKLIYEGSMFKTLKYIEFPSDADFTMFILKWS